MYGFGLNNYHQVSKQNKPKSFEISEVTHLEELDGKYIVEVQGGEFFSIALSLDGSIYSWGRGDNGQLGRLIQKTDAGAFDPIPTKVPNIPPMYQVSCGATHVLAIDKKGDLYSWGFAESYQLGHGDDSFQSPKKVEGVQNVKRAACGSQHSVILLG